MQRVLIIGPGGAGKTTLAKRLAEFTHIPLVHLDALFWHPGWVSTPDAEWDRIVCDLIARDTWVMDGNYGRTLARRIEAADTIIFLDFPAWRCLWRVIRRRMEYGGRPRPDMPEGCPERMTWEFLTWIASYRKRRRPGILRTLNDIGDAKTVVLLQTPREVAAFLESVARTRA